MRKTIDSTIKLQIHLYFHRKYYEMQPNMPTFRRFLSTYRSKNNQIVETTMGFTAQDFTTSGTPKKMIENENIVCFPC